MAQYELKIPADFLEFEWEVESKGSLDMLVIFAEKEYRLQFYDMARLTQEIIDSLTDRKVFYENNLVVVSKVNLSNIENAINSVNPRECISNHAG